MLEYSLFGIFIIHPPAIQDLKVAEIIQQCYLIREPNFMLVKTQINPSHIIIWEWPHDLEENRMSDQLRLKLYHYASFI